jgi:NAD(P)-dependent dehydrogenase (short-subunit alcohol dehydrogenase family)
MKLLPTMMRTSKDHSVATHISVTSSHSHFDIQHPDREFDFSMFTNTKTITSGKLMDFNIRYARSKLANNLFVKHLSHLLTTPEYEAQGGNRVYVNIAHPGFINTDIQDSIAEVSNKVVGSVFAWTGRTFGITPAEGALTQLFLVTSERIKKEGIRGRYFVPIAKE